MNIQAIKPLNSLEELNNIKQSDKKSEALSQNPFKTIFEDALNNVNESSQKWNEEVIKLATGETDNLHDVMIASTKYTMSVELLVQLRNKALEAYNEIMNMGV
ncbi:MAG TPA: flagellar hook-basal body complex protein FliE [Clostridiales bacterium]|nr:flagellar hook-basal body complex protein FliE [Clostridiales bacterium]